MNVAVCLPRYIENSSEQHVKMLHELGRAHLDWRPYVVTGIPNLDIVRAALATNALDSGADFIIWIDADIVAPRASIERVLAVAQQEDAVAGAIYVDRRGSGNVAVRTLEIRELFTQEVTDVEAVGFGLCVTPRSAFERIQRSPAKVPAMRLGGWTGATIVHPYFTTDLRWEELTSDDYAFCRRVRISGGRVLAVDVPGVLHGGLGARAG